MFYKAKCVHFGLILGALGGGAWPIYPTLDPPSGRHFCCVVGYERRYVGSLLIMWSVESDHIKTYSLAYIHTYMVYEGKISTCTSACSCPWNMAILYLTIYLDSSNTSRRHFKVIYSPYPKVNDNLYAEQ